MSVRITVSFDGDMPDFVTERESIGPAASLVMAWFASGYVLVPDVSDRDAHYIPIHRVVSIERKVIAEAAVPVKGAGQ